MGFGNISADISEEIVNLLPSELISKIDRLVLISEIAVLLFIIYIVFLIIKNIYTFKIGARVGKINNKIDEIDRKLDLLLGSYKKSKENEKSKKKGILSKLFRKKGRKK